jgi:hypothetical protein
MVTLFVSLCAGATLVHRLQPDHFRQVVGRYFLSSVLGVQSQSMLPA